MLRPRGRQGPWASRVQGTTGNTEQNQQKMKPPGETSKRDGASRHRVPPGPCPRLARRFHTRQAQGGWAWDGALPASRRQESCSVLATAHALRDLQPHAGSAAQSQVSQQRNEARLSPRDMTVWHCPIKVAGTGRPTAVGISTVGSALAADPRPGCPEHTRASENNENTRGRVPAWQTAAPSSTRSQTNTAGGAGHGPPHLPWQALGVRPGRWWRVIRLSPASRRHGSSGQSIPACSSDCVPSIPR